MSLLDQLFQYSFQNNDISTLLSLSDFDRPPNNPLQASQFLNQSQSSHQQFPWIEMKQTGDADQTQLKPIPQTKQISIFSLLTQHKPSSKQQAKLSKLVSVLNSKILKHYYLFFINQEFPNQQQQQTNIERASSQAQHISHLKNMSQLIETLEGIALKNILEPLKHYESTKLQKQFKQICLFSGKIKIFNKFIQAGERLQSRFVRQSFKQLKKREILHAKIEIFLNMLTVPCQSIQKQRKMLGLNSLKRYLFEECFSQKKLARQLVSCPVSIICQLPRTSIVFKEQGSFKFAQKGQCESAPAQLHPVKIDCIGSQLNDMEDTIHLFLSSSEQQMGSIVDCSQIKDVLSWNGSLIQQIQEEFVNESVMNILQLDATPALSEKEISVLYAQDPTSIRQMPAKTMSTSKQPGRYSRQFDNQTEYQQCGQFSTVKKAKGRPAEKLFQEVLLNLDERFNQLQLFNQNKSHQLSYECLNKQKESLKQRFSISKNAKSWVLAESFLQGTPNTNIELKGRKSLTITQLEKDKKIIEVLIQELKKNAKSQKPDKSDNRGDMSEQRLKKKKKVVQAIQKISKIQEKSVSRCKQSNKVKAQSLSKPGNKVERNDARVINSSSKKYPPRKKRMSAFQDRYAQQELSISTSVFQKGSPFDKDRTNTKQFQQEISLGNSYAPLFQNPFQQIISVPTTKRSNQKPKICLMNDYYKEKSKYQAKKASNSSVQTVHFKSVNQNQDKKCISIKLKKQNNFLPLQRHQMPPKTRNSKRIQQDCSQWYDIIAAAKTKKAQKCKIADQISKERSLKSANRPINKQNYEIEHLKASIWNSNLNYHSAKNSASKSILQPRLSINIRDCLLQINPLNIYARKKSLN